MMDKITKDNKGSPNRDQEGQRRNKRAKTDGTAAPAASASGTSSAMSSSLVTVRDIDPLHVAVWTPRGKCLVVKCRAFQFINAQTPPWVVVQLAKIAGKMYIYGGFGKTGDGIALLRHINVGHSIIDQVLGCADYADLFSNCSEQNARENKEIFWLFAAALCVCFFEVKAKKQFTIQYYHPKELVEQFLAMHPELALYDGLLISRLLTFHLCTQIVVSAFELSVATESDVQRLIELVVRMTEGPELAHGAYRSDEAAPEPIMFGAAPPAVVKAARRGIFDKILEIKRNTRRQKEMELAAASREQEVVESLPAARAAPLTPGVVPVPPPVPTPRSPAEGGSASSAAMNGLNLIGEAALLTSSAEESLHKEIKIEDCGIDGVVT